MRSDILGEWLPLALADLLCAWCDANKGQVLRNWGLHAMADRQEDADAAAFLNGFKEGTR